MDRLRNEWARAAHGVLGSIGQPRFATVVSVDPDNHSAVITIQPDGQQIGPVPVYALQVGGGRGVVALPSPGDQVTFLPHQGDAGSGAIIPGLFSLQSRPPRSPATEQSIQPGEFAVFTEGAWLHISGGTIHAEATEFRLKAKLLVDGDVEITGDLKVSKTVRALQDVLAKTVSLFNHLHNGVKRGPSPTDPPTP